MGVEDIINFVLLKGCGPAAPAATPSSELKSFVLIILLMRAGLSLKPTDMLRKSLMVSLFCIVPSLCEFGVQFCVARKMLGWTAVDTGLMISILSALGPSLVIPSMIKLVQEE
jgi:hypothetical protein